MLEKQAELVDGLCVSVPVRLINSAALWAAAVLVVLAAAIYGSDSVSTVAAVFMVMSALRPAIAR